MQRFPRGSKMTCFILVPKPSIPPPLHSDCPCIVSGGGGGEGTGTFCFSNLLRRSDIELLLCVCWLDEVMLLVHCLKRNARAVQLFGRLAVVETHTL